MVKVLQEEPTVTVLCISWYGFLIMTEYGVVVAGYPFLTAWWRCINQMIFFVFTRNWIILCLHYRKQQTQFELRIYLILQSVNHGCLFYALCPVLKRLKLSCAFNYWWWIFIHQVTERLWLGFEIKRGCHRYIFLLVIGFP